MRCTVYTPNEKHVTKKQGLRDVYPFRQCHGPFTHYSTSSATAPVMACMIMATGKNGVFKICDFLPRAGFALYSVRLGHSNTDNNGPGATSPRAKPSLPRRRSEHSGTQKLCSPTPFQKPPFLNWSIEPGPPPDTLLPYQDNSYDCGVLVCLYAAFIAIQKPFTFSQADIDDVRMSQWMVHLMDKDGKKQNRDHRRLKDQALNPLNNMQLTLIAPNWSPR
jgi:hypothetical protein